MALESRHSDKSKEAKDRFKVWLLQAEFDIKAAKIMSQSKFHEWACYLAIQAVEKSLKSVIVHSGFRPPKIHKLGVLVSMTNRANKLFEGVKFDFRKIESFTFISRYPFVIPGDNKTPHEKITKQDSDTCLAIASDIFNKVSEFVFGQPSHADEDKTLGDYYFTKEEVDSRIHDIVERLKADSEIDLKKVILFGTFARDKTRPKTSTMDLLIIAETQKDFIDRLQHVRDLTKGAEPILEPIVYTPKEFSYMMEEEGEGFLESAVEEGKIVYDVELAYTESSA